jgi:hypothetical protein
MRALSSWVKLPPTGRRHSHAGLDLHYPMPCSKPLISGMPNPGGSSYIKTSLRLSSRLKFYHPKLTLSSIPRRANRCPHSEVVIKRKYFACIFCGVPLLLCGCWYHHLAPFGLSCQLHLLLVAYWYNNIGKVLLFTLFFRVFWLRKSGISPVRQPYCVFLPHLLLQMWWKLYFLLVCSTREFCSICTQIMTNLVSLPLVLSFCRWHSSLFIKEFWDHFLPKGRQKIEQIKSIQAVSKPEMMRSIQFNHQSAVISELFSNHLCKQFDP